MHKIQFRSSPKNQIGRKSVIIKAAVQQRTNNHNASNINEIIIMKSWWNQNVTTTQYSKKLLNLEFCRSHNFHLHHAEYIFVHRHVTREAKGVGLPCPFSKIGKKFPNLEKKCSDYGHLWVWWNKMKFLRAYRQKNRIFFVLAGSFFLVL